MKATNIPALVLLAEAVVDTEAVRFRPMLLTALVVVVGSVILAIARMVGEIASLLISRMAVPVLFFMANKHAKSGATPAS